MTKKLIGIILISIFLTGCNNTADSKSNEYSYDEFQNTFNLIVENVGDSNLKVRGQSDDKNITIIDKELSFGKRKFLTLDGKEDSRETQERILLENTEKNIVAVIDLMYLKNELNNDLIHWSIPRTHDVKDTSFIDSYETVLFSYKNLLAHVMVYTENDNIDKIKVTRELVRKVQSILQEDQE